MTANGSSLAARDGPARAPGAVPGPACAPGIAVVRGEPTAVEIAALITVLAARQRLARPAAVRPRARSQWADRGHLLRAPVTAGPGAWRASALPW